MTSNHHPPPSINHQSIDTILTYSLPYRYFAETLQLPLTVAPNFATQECQWSFGEQPVEPELDPSWPRGCIVDCPTRGVVM